MNEDYAKLYCPLHANGKWFHGTSICAHEKIIGKLVAQTESNTLLDYGCGKGFQYLSARIHENWGGILPHCYDIGVYGLDKRPQGRFDGVLCCDMLEHIAEGDVNEILADVIGFADKFVFLVIGLVLSRNNKLLKDGRNVHLTIKPAEWWKARIRPLRRKGLIIETRFDIRVRPEVDGYPAAE